MRTVQDIPVFHNIPILVRCAFNIPLEKGKVVHDHRLREALPTLSYLTERGARVIIISHIGDKGTETLAPVVEALSKHMPNVSFYKETTGEGVRAAVHSLLPGHILVLENLRRDAGEKKNDDLFARELALLADVFVQDSFDTCHRLHASIVGIPRFLPSYAGLTLEREVAELSHSLTPKKPSCAIIGGAKFATKKVLLERLLSVYDTVCVGGALANDFLKTKGVEVGKSLVSLGDEASLRDLMQNPRLLLPSDVTVIPYARVWKENMRGFAEAREIDEVSPDEVILDLGPDTLERLTEKVQGAKTILWNGPLGNFENGFVDSTRSLARAIAASSAYSVVGGGDTVAAIEDLDLFSRFSFVSTGGGAMLEFLAKGTLPGIEALG
jgi:phosphoglycerate kinase